MRCEPFRQFQSILCVSLSAQAQGFDSEPELLSRERVKGRTEITKNLNTDTNGKCYGAKGFPEFQSVVTGRWLDELWETGGVLTPVELARVDNNTTNGCTMTSDPFLFDVRAFLTVSST
jgi:hypothetical protein